MMKRSARPIILVAILALLVLSNVLDAHLTPIQNKYVTIQTQEADPKVPHGPDGSAVGKTQFSSLIPAMLGLREVTASLMWIQADDLFHRGEYLPVLQLIRQITLIDPHQIDVYATGAWHMAYNFMDKRLIQDGVDFLEEGTKNNPRVYDLFFELGYTHNDKTKDFAAATHWLRQAMTKQTTTGKEIPPPFVFSHLAHTYERAGDMDAAQRQFEENIARLKEQLKENPDESTLKMSLAPAIHNIYMLQRRRNERMARQLEGDGNTAEALKRWEMNVALAQEFLGTHPDLPKDLAEAKRNVLELKQGRRVPAVYRGQGFDFTYTKTAPRKIKVTGTIDVTDLSRVFITLRDKDYDNRVKGRTLEWRRVNTTLEWDRIPVKGGKFEHEINLDRDPADMGRRPSEVYPLAAEEYELVVRYEPRIQPVFVQDVIGWSGERLAPGPHLKVDESRAAIIEGKRVPLRYYEKTLILKKSDILYPAAECQAS